MRNKLKNCIARLLPKNNFARGVSVLVGGTAGAQFVALLAAPLLTRLYGPEDFGVLAVYLGILSLFSVISSLRYELAIPLPEDESDVVALSYLSLLLVLITATFSSVLIIFGGEGLANLLQVPTLTDYLWLLPIGILFSGFYQIFTYWAVRLKEFPVLAKTKLRQQLVTAAVQISAYKVGGVGMLLGQVSGRGVGVLTLAKKVVARESWKKLPIKKVKFVAWRYRNFPFFSTWGAFLNTAGSQVPPILIASIFGASSAGFYALAYRIIALPMAVVGQAIGQVFLSNAAIDYRAGRLPPLVVSAHRALVKIILPPVLFLILFGPVSFSIVFGNDWTLSGEIASWLALWLLVSFSTSPLSSIFTIVEKQHLGMLMQAFLLLMRVCGIGIGAYYKDFMLGVILYSVFNVIGYVFYQVMSFRVIGLPTIEVFRSFVIAAPAITFSLIIKNAVFFENFYFVVSSLFIFLVCSGLYYRAIAVDHLNY